MKIIRILVLLFTINTVSVQAMHVGSRREKQAIQTVAACLFFAMYFPSTAKDVVVTTANYVATILPSSSAIASSMSMLSDWVTPVVSPEDNVKNVKNRKVVQLDTGLFTFPWGDNN